MTQTKLQILGPYTPEHEGPFCTRDGRPVRVLCSDMQNDYSIVAIVTDEDGKETVSTFLSDGRFSAEDENPERDLMNAREVPVAREFWIVGGLVFSDEKEARRIHTNDMPRSETIHVREVLPGDGE